MTEAALAGEHLSFVSNGRRILHDITCHLARHRITALIGPNGSGKSTLMRLLMRLQTPTSGKVLLHGQEASLIQNRQFARQVAFLPQDMQIPPGLSVRELVACGRHPHRALWRTTTREDRHAVDEALQETGLTNLASRYVGALSGGERQRALIAMALAQQTTILMLDEPTTYLDLRYQIQTLELIRRLQYERNLTVCWVLHDLNEAAAYSDEVIVLAHGCKIASGACAEILTPELVHDVFQVDMLRLSHPQDGHTILVPSRRDSFMRQRKPA